MDLPDPLTVHPVEGPLDAVVTIPGSKSLTNRALVCAALAEGRSELAGALAADDTFAMVDGLLALGFDVEADWEAGRIVVEGAGGRTPAEVGVVDARLSGTTSRFLLPVAALGTGTYRIDGSLGLRARPMHELARILRGMGVEVREAGAPGHLPLDLSGGPAPGGTVVAGGSVSSQFISGLLMAAPAMRTGVHLTVEGDLVSRPYVELTTSVMRAFGVAVDQTDPQRWAVEPQTYRGRRFVVEPDASAAAYAFAAAAIVGGQVTVEGLGTGSGQGDLAFVDLLEQMGARVEREEGRTTVAGTGTLHGLDADLSQVSDVAQTLAVVAAFADGPSRFTGIGFIRGKETDRVGNVVAELVRAGVDAVEEPDGYRIRPGAVHGATIRTYDDHRMAMAFALLGLRVPGIRISDPGCVAKTFPGYWAMLEGLRTGRGDAARVPPS